MHLQGNLQTVFDALYELGVIDPILDKDWQKDFVDRHRFEKPLRRAVDVVNRAPAVVTSMIQELKQFDAKTLEYLAMEVAREFAEYHARTHIH